MGLIGNVNALQSPLGNQGLLLTIISFTSIEHHLFIKVSEYLKQHPTTKESPLRLRIPGMPPDTKAPEPPAVPKGWKLGTVLPFHSAAVSGGGVSENMFKDIMSQMGGGQAGAMPPAVEEPVSSKKKDKKPKQKIIRA